MEEVGGSQGGPKKLIWTLSMRVFWSAYELFSRFLYPIQIINSNDRFHTVPNCYLFVCLFQILNYLLVWIFVLGTRNETCIFIGWTAFHKKRKKKKRSSVKKRMCGSKKWREKLNVHTCINKFQINTARNNERDQFRNQ